MLHSNKWVYGCMYVWGRERERESLSWLFLNEASVPSVLSRFLSDAGLYNYCELAHIQPILI